MIKPALALIAICYSVTVMADDDEPDYMQTSGWGNETSTEVEEDTVDRFDPSQMYRSEDEPDESEYEQMSLPYGEDDDFDEEEFGSGGEEYIDEEDELPESELYDDE